RLRWRLRCKCAGRHHLGSRLGEESARLPMRAQEFVDALPQNLVVSTRLFKIIAPFSGGWLGQRLAENRLNTLRIVWRHWKPLDVRHLPMRRPRSARLTKSPKTSIVASGKIRLQALEQPSPRISPIS